MGILKRKEEKYGWRGRVWYVGGVVAKPHRIAAEVWVDISTRDLCRSSQSAQLTALQKNNPT